jgi:uncharacterized cupin superfamily protein
VGVGRQIAGEFAYRDRDSFLEQVMNDPKELVMNLADAPEQREGSGAWGASYRALTPGMRGRGGSLGVNYMRVSPGCTAVPFHYHLREDEVFYVLAGRGVLRYGEELIDIKAGDCIACPAGTRIAHQIANPGGEDLEYLSIGPWDPHEVCGYPDSGKIMVRSEQTVGYLQATEYMDGEPERPKVLDLIAQRGK